MLTACTQAGDGGGGSRPPGSAKGASGSPSASAEAVPPAAPTKEADPARVPRTASAATALVRAVIADPELVGAGAVRATPYESDPGSWAVLGADCAWQRERLPRDVLATLTRYFEVPAKKGQKGQEATRLSATVTVHRTTLDAAWEQAGMLEEAMGCPQQTLSADERLTGLASSAFGWGENSNFYADDVLREGGECRRGTGSGSRPYHWTQATFGPVVVSVSSCGEQAGNEGQAVDPADSLTLMLNRAEDKIGRPVGRASGTATPSAGEGGA
ncbi:hypothetical protein AB0I77_06930 [Streptomyces sp. NPDC050619]|uniref:hypothetical protein n=1 Tax=Streptomyces sp. NPDC050619 TaxID=3157214 RepID=UPI00343D4011